MIDAIFLQFIDFTLKKIFVLWEIYYFTKTLKKPVGTYRNFHMSQKT